MRGPLSTLSHLEPQDPTTDHLPINRGFDSHAGYLAGAEYYDRGFNYDPTHDCAGTPKHCVYDVSAHA